MIGTQKSKIVFWEASAQDFQMIQKIKKNKAEEHIRNRNRKIGTKDTLASTTHELGSEGSDFRANHAQITGMKIFLRY